MIELMAAVSAGVLVMASVIVQHANTIYQKGAGFALTDRSEPLASTGFTGRTARTLQNNLESAAIAIPFMVVIHLLGLSSDISQGACVLYVAARASFTFSYWFGASFIRSVSWAAGMLSLLVLAAVITNRFFTFLF